MILGATFFELRQLPHTFIRHPGSRFRILDCSRRCIEEGPLEDDHRHTATVVSLCKSRLSVLEWTQLENVVDVKFNHPHDKP